MRRLLLVLITLVSAPAAFGCDTPEAPFLSDLRLATTCGFASASVAMGDESAFAAWHMTRAGFGSISGTSYGARLDESGRLAVPVQSNYGGGLGRPIIVSDGRDFLLVTYAYGSTFARIVRASGDATSYVTLTTSSIAPFTNPGFSGNAFAVWTGDEYLVVATEILRDAITNVYRPRVVAVTVSRDGMAGRVSVIADGTIVEGVARAARGRSLVVWRRGDVLELAFLTGSILSSSPSPLPGVTAPLSMAAGEKEFVVVTATGALRLDANGVPSGAPFPIAADMVTPRVVAEGDHYLVIWNSSMRIRAARITSTGVMPSFDIGDGKLWSVASNRERTIVVFGTPCGAIASRSIPRDAVAPTDESILSIDPIMQTTPRLIATDRGHQVSWLENRALLTRFVKDDGTFGDVLIVTTGEDDPFKYQVYATRVAADGTVLQRVLLSREGEDGFNAVTGSDGSQWVVAWRNGSTSLVSVAMPHDDLRIQSRRTDAVITTGVAFISAVSGGADPAIIWQDRTDRTRLHAFFVKDEADVVVAESNDIIDGVRIADDEVFWNERGAPSWRILSAPLSRSASPLREHACFLVPHLNFDIRNGAIGAVAYNDGPRLRIQLMEKRPPVRRRAVRTSGF